LEDLLGLLFDVLFEFLIQIVFELSAEGLMEFVHRKGKESAVFSTLSLAMNGALGGLFRPRCFRTGSFLCIPCFPA
jgi:hypothetical protein